MKSFEELPIAGEILRSLHEIGFREMFPIQAAAIGPLLQGRDVIGQAKTGTGKTAAFGIPMVQKIIRNEDVCSRVSFWFRRGNLHIKLPQI